MILHKNKIIITVLLLSVVIAIFFLKDRGSKIVNIQSPRPYSFSHVTSSLQLLINKNGNTKVDNNFCIIKDETGGDYPIYICYWVKIGRAHV